MKKQFTFFKDQPRNAALIRQPVKATRYTKQELIQEEPAYAVPYENRGGEG
jgi:hypothetical protein